MIDVELYSSDSAEQYDKLQNLRPDYKPAIETALDMAYEQLKEKTDIVVTDFCCGPGLHTKALAQKLHGIDKAILIDINEAFIRKAKSLAVESRNTETQCTDILTAHVKPEADAVLSLFAYHHVPDTLKRAYIRKAKEALKPGGILVLAEIYLPSQEATLAYYAHLFKAIPKEQQNWELEQFLIQTAESTRFEYKVAKSFADAQFTEEGFALIDSKKIWPHDTESNLDDGTFVEIWQLKQ